MRVDAAPLLLALSSLVVAASGPLFAQQQTTTVPALASADDKAAPPATPTTDEKEKDATDGGGRLKGISRRLGGLTSQPSDKDGGFSIAPGIIVAGSGLSADVGYRRLNVIPGGVDIELGARMSVRRYQEYSTAIGWLDARSSTLEFDTADSKVPSLFNASARKSPGSAVYADLRYRSYPQHTYFGEGINSLATDKSDYSLSGTSVEGVWQWQFAPTLGLSARGGWLGLHVGPGHNDELMNLEDRFVTARVSGAIDQPHFMTYGLGLVHDTRQQPGAPEDGRMIGVSARQFTPVSGPDLAFTRLTLDLRGYQRAFLARGVIAARVLVSSDLSGNDGPTPFYLRQSLGGGDTLRGFHSYRFADQALAHATVEYRWRVHRYVELAPFVDAGTVAPGLSRLSLGSLKASPGIGIRGRNDRRVFGRLDWGWSTEGQRIVIGTGAAF